MREYTGLRGAAQVELPVSGTVLRIMLYYMPLGDEPQPKKLPLCPIVHKSRATSPY